MTDDAINRFLGREGYKKVNCAQAIAAAFDNTYPIDQAISKQFKKMGGGKAPGRVCGAYHAAKVALESHSPQDLPQLEQHFLDEAGSLICRDIRKAKTLKCSECVEKAAQFLVLRSN